MRDQTILIVEDVPSQALVYQEYLRDLGAEVLIAASGTEAKIKIFSDAPPDVLLLDLSLPDIDGMEILKQIHGEGLDVVSIVITANGSMNVAVEAMKYGAYDFLVKPFEKEKLLVTIKNGTEKQILSKTVEVYKKEYERESFYNFIGSSLPMQAVYRQIESAAPSKATVFITGESGTGKEVCAEAIHSASERASGPFIALNCGAIPKDLIESEVFGHVKGAFTGATADREGAAERANGGTLFLDEICELDMNLQVKLLRFLQTGTFTKVGGDREEKVDIRIVCATNRDPVKEVQQGRFREDLYYRLHVIPIVMPPLRVREDDVLEIANHFLRANAEKEAKEFVGFADEVEVILQNYTWPGNVRELLNSIQNIVVMNDGEEVTIDMLPGPLSKITAGKPHHPQRRASDSIASGAKKLDRDVFAFPTRPEQIKPLAEVERDIIEQAIKACAGNIPKAAALLEINPSTIYRKRAAWQTANEEVV